MVDWAATEKFAHGLTEQGREETAASDDARAVDAEEAAEKAEMTSRTPPVAPRLNLPDRDGVWVLDYFRNQPELVTLEQDSGNINQRTGHNVQRAPINPAAEEGGGASGRSRIEGASARERAGLLCEPDRRRRYGRGRRVDAWRPMMQRRRERVSSPKSQYVIVELDPRRDYRVITNVTLGQVGHQSENVTETTTTVMPGGHWMKVVPKQKLTVGQYALMELLSPREANISVWDFAVDPQSGDNLNTIVPIFR